jgi:hypothetical protein
MTDNIADILRGPPPSQMGKFLCTRNALKLLLAIYLVVAYAGCVNTKPGDFNAPESPSDRRPF